MEQADWLAGRTLGELRLRDEGVVVLGVHREDGDYVGVPGKGTRLAPADNLVVYCHDTKLAELSARRGRTGRLGRQPAGAGAQRTL